MSRLVITFYLCYYVLSIYFSSSKIVRVDGSQTKEELHELQTIVQRNSKILKERHGEEVLSRGASSVNSVKEYSSIIEEDQNHIDDALLLDVDEKVQKRNRQERRRVYVIDEVGDSSDASNSNIQIEDSTAIDKISHSSSGAATTHMHSGTTHSHDIIIPKSSNSYQCLWGWSCICSSSSDLIGSDTPGGLKIMAGTGTSLSHSHSVMHAHEMPSSDASDKRSHSHKSHSSSHESHSSHSHDSHSSGSHGGSEFHHGNHEHGSGHSGSAHSISSFSGQSGSVKNLWVGTSQYHKDADCECKCNEPPPTASPV